MTNVLVLGGTRFFGKNLVELLLKEQIKVTLLTRGKTEDEFGDQVQRLVVDREDAVALEKAIGDQQYDVVYDNICFTPQQAREAVSIFQNKTKRYILTSSLSVYDFGTGICHESDVDTHHYTIDADPEAELSYGEGKRQAEAVFFQQADFPVAAVRFPIVLGPNDYTKRLDFHVERVLSGKVIGISNLEAQMNFIHEQEAAEFLFWLGISSELTGPVNARSDGEVRLRELVQWIEQGTEQQAIIQSETDDEAQSPFGVPDSWIMDTSKAKQDGFQFYVLSEWMPALIKQMATQTNR
ncbi:NAD-dependent epimerase/dehydratase family protein [Paenibacillus sp. PK4536]|uniref:NAD-dependent epimerase/dehydratase family protein n=1 Tax=Paenibacillus sp. PK4536 TaxID=3024576 RepID=UPI002358FE4C|nr:NAD-dependent epimerase/dehydratase family protein [Paenibacillus sp. PK4536]WIM37903.1 NAD-dependent epimerase/dehydratase family protein [Paenibacillus sp. PK4536]